MPGTAAAIGNLLYRTGALDAVHSVWSSRLTVLAYHRVVDTGAPEFDTLKANVSATPAGFAAQMEYLARHFAVVSLGDVLDWLRGDGRLPRNPALITFDDGYRDNFDHALPELTRLGLPAAIFLATDCIGSAVPFYWDLFAYAFSRSGRRSADLPLMGPQSWTDADTMALRWIGAAKALPDDAKRAAAQALTRVLEVEPPEGAFRSLHMSWDHVRRMVACGIDMGAHTRSHPILARIPPDRVRAEVAGSKARIEVEIGRPVTAFAYPNGQPGDFDRVHQAILADAGFEAAFSLLPGPAPLADVRREPLAIRRITVINRDDLPHFAAKLSGLSRLLGRH